MKSEDEQDAEIAELFDEDTTPQVEMVNGKPRISDEATLAQMEREEAARRMEEACGMFLTAERRFQKLSALPDVVSDPICLCINNAIDGIVGVQEAEHLCPDRKGAPIYWKTGASEL